MTLNFEKKKHPRFSVDLPVEYYKLGSMVKHEGKAMNASLFGLDFYATYSVFLFDMCEKRGGAIIVKSLNAFSIFPMAAFCISLEVLK